MKVAGSEIKGWEQKSFEKLKDKHEVVLTEAAVTEKLESRFRDADIISTFIYSELNEKTLAQFENLKFISIRSTGVNHIDADYCREHRISVSSAPAYGQNTVAEHAFALIHALSRHVPGAVDYLSEKYNLPSVSVGDMVRKMAKEKGLSLARENLEKIASVSIHKHGKEFFMKRVVECIREKGWNQAGVTGIRTPDNVRYLKHEIGENFILFHVYIEDSHIRYKRLTRRGREGDPQRYDDFLEQDRKEEETFHIKQAASMADYSLDNSGTLEDLHRQIDAILAINKLQKQLQKGIENESSNRAIPGRRGGSVSQS